MMKKLLSFFISLIIITGCSQKQSEQGFLDSAKKNVKENKVNEAIINYETLLEEFPESPLAPEALFQMGTLYQNQKVPNMGRIESFEKAIQCFKKIQNKYPTSDNAPKALFMAGFMEANELKRYNEATTTYNTFLQKYPNNELASAAKDELDYMGLEPEQMLQKKEVSSKGK